MHDSARLHDARMVQWYMEVAWIKVMNWPVFSMDLNP